MFFGNWKNCGLKKKKKKKKKEKKKKKLDLTDL